MKRYLVKPRVRLNMHCFPGNVLPSASQSLFRARLKLSSMTFLSSGKHWRSVTSAQLLSPINKCGTTHPGSLNDDEVIIR